VAKAIITPDRDAVISEVEIAAPLDRVFQALIRREQFSGFKIRRESTPEVSWQT
jgi:uncharacterized protein YndB with AHSA1/START domain